MCWSIWPTSTSSAGSPAVPVVVSAAAEEAAVVDAVRGAALDPPDDVHASAAYRRHLAEVLAVRAVSRARERKH